MKSPTPGGASHPNPFVGLRPFERADSLYYFGRDTQVRALLGLLDQSRLLAVVGSSGCGKSSLVRAGLIPALEAGFLVETRADWRIATLKPGAAPLRHLAAALLRLTGPAAAPPDARPDPDADQALADQLLDEGPAGVLTALHVGPADPAATNWLLIVDQFEELFRFGLGGDAAASARAEAEALVALLLALTRQDQVPVYAVLTMRSDFIGDCDAFAGLPEAINRGQFLVPRLTRAQRREAITGPLRLAGTAIAPRLVDRLLNERPGTRDDLPILQHLLMRCWDDWALGTRAAGEAGPIDLDHYERVHTIHAALDRHAGEALAELLSADPANGPIARRLFQALTELDPGNRRIRRPVHLSEAAAIAEVPPARLWPVIDAFRRDGRNFLVLSAPLGPHADPLADPIIDISHESLIRQWQTLHRWVDEEAAAARTYRRLSETAALAAAGQAGPYRDADLKQARAWLRQARPNAAWAHRYPGDFTQAMAFLRDSRERACAEQRERRAAVRERERLLADKAELAERQAATERAGRRRARQWSLALGLLSMLMLVIAGAAGWLWLEAERQTELARQATAAAETSAREAETERVRAAEQAHVADEARRRADDQLLAASRNLARGHEEQAVRISAKRADEITTRDYQEALLHALEAQRQPLRNAAGLRRAALNQWETAGFGLAFIQSSNTPNRILGNGSYVVAFSANGKLLAAGDDDAVLLWDPITGKEVRALKGHEGWISALAFNPDGNLLASGSEDRTIRLWDPSTGKPLRTLTGHEETVVAVAFSPDGSVVASSSQDDTVRLWDTKTGNQIASNLHGGHAPIAFSPNGRSIVVNHYLSLRMWDPNTKAPVREFSGPGGNVFFFRDFVYTPDGRFLVGGDDGVSSVGRVGFWDAATGERVRTLGVDELSVQALDISRDGRLLAIGAKDATVRLWDLRTGVRIRILRGHQSGPKDIAFSPDGRLLASVAGDDTVRVWTLPNPREGALLVDTPAPSPRPALISEALQRLWGLKVDGLEITEHDWRIDPPRQGYDIEQLITIDVRTAAETADPASQPILRTFDIRPLFDPPRPDQDKLDQFLDWLAEQERLEPRLASPQSGSDKPAPNAEQSAPPAHQAPTEPPQPVPDKPAPDAEQSAPPAHQAPTEAPQPVPDKRELIPDGGPYAHQEQQPHTADSEKRSGGVQRRSPPLPEDSRPVRHYGRS